MTEKKRMVQVLLMADLAPLLISAPKAPGEVGNLVDILVADRWFFEGLHGIYHRFTLMEKKIKSFIW